jgi:hypothetical protein
VGRASGLAMTHGHRNFTVCSCSSLPVLLPGDLRGSGKPREPLDHRGGVRRTGDAQRSNEGAPPDRNVQTLLVGMQPRTPPRQITRCIDRDGLRAVSVVNSGHSKQFDGQPTLPASDARTHWSLGTSMQPRAGSRTLALDHGSVYRHERRRMKRVPPTPRGQPPARPPRRVRAPRRCECRSATP